MTDIWHEWGGDLMLTGHGDLLLVRGSEEGRQRVIRRLLTNPGDLLFHPEYGAGLPKKIGETTRAANIEPTVRRQMFYEEAVSQDPPPDVKVTNGFGTVTVHIVYRDAETADPVGVGFTVER